MAPKRCAANLYFNPKKPLHFCSRLWSGAAPGRAQVRVGPVVLVQDAVPRPAVRHHPPLPGARLARTAGEEEVEESQIGTSGILSIHVSNTLSWQRPFENIKLFFHMHSNPPRAISISRNLSLIAAISTGHPQK